MIQAAVIGQTFGMLNGVCLTLIYRVFQIYILIFAATSRSHTSTDISWNGHYGKFKAYKENAEVLSILVGRKKRHF